MPRYFAKVNAENRVEDVQIIDDPSVVTDEDGKNFLNKLFKTNDNWIQTYKDGSKRVHFAYIEGHYNPEHDVFYDWQPFASWTLNTDTWTYSPPKPQPEARPNRETYWNEEAQLWMFRKTVPDFDDDPVE